LHSSADVVRYRLARIFDWAIEAVAWLLFFLDLMGFVLLVID
jgi:hypothetical protein